MLFYGQFCSTRSMHIYKKIVPKGLAKTVSREGFFSLELGKNNASI